MAGEDHQSPYQPLTHLNIRIQDLEVPDYGTLQTWEHASDVARASTFNPNANDTTLNGQGGIPKLFLLDIKSIVKTELADFVIFDFDFVVENENSSFIISD
ncbi:hypothetical protein Tco_1103115 [Tanacetum coccineum]